MLPALLFLCLPSAGHGLPTPPTLATSSTSNLLDEEFEALVAEVDAAVAAWTLQLEAARERARNAGERLSASAWSSPKKPYVLTFMRAAKRRASTDAAIPYLRWVAQNALPMVGPERAAAKGAVRILVTEHRRSPELASLGWMLGRMDYFFEDPAEASAAGLGLEQDSPVPEVRAWATFSRLSRALNEASVESAEYLQAKDQIARILGDVELPDLAAEVANRVALRESFSLGMEAPDIEGLDLDGTAFALSDYRGKILFIDFWGDW